MRFNVTFEIVTPESAADGCAAEFGFVIEGVSLRDALGELKDFLGCWVEADSYPISVAQPPRWFTFQCGPKPRDGAEESRSLHLPATITASSAMRIARLVGCHGVK